MIVDHSFGMSKSMLVFLVFVASSTKKTMMTKTKKVDWLKLQF